MVEIRHIDVFDLPHCLSIAHLLPEWFTTSGIAKLTKDLLLHEGVVAVQDQKIVGFITYYLHENDAIVTWMAVSPTERRKGIGRSLMDELARDLFKRKISDLYVSTLGETVDHPPFEETRAFYRTIGFEHHEIKFHPGNPEMPEELILRLSLD